jgi:hypothetical protein
MKKKQPPPADPSAVKDPSEWKTGDEPMTGPQKSYLGTLAQEAGEPVEQDLTKAEASEKIEELQDKTGRGQGTRRPNHPPKRKARRTAE